MRIDRGAALKLSALTVAAVTIHGYHLGVDDAEIYVPGIKRAADPGLYWFGSEFFESHAHLTFFPNIVGGLARWTHLSADWAILLVHIVSVALLLAAAWHLA